MYAETIQAFAIANPMIVMGLAVAAAAAIATLMSN